MSTVFVNWKVIFFDALVFVQDASESFLAHFPSKVLGVKVFGEIFGSHDGEVVRSGDGERVARGLNPRKLFFTENREIRQQRIARFRRQRK